MKLLDEVLQKLCKSSIRLFLVALPMAESGLVSGSSPFPLRPATSAPTLASSSPAAAVGRVSPGSSSPGSIPVETGRISDRQAFLWLLQATAYQCQFLFGCILSPTGVPSGVGVLSGFSIPPLPLFQMQQTSGSSCWRCVALLRKPSLTIGLPMPPLLAPLMGSPSISSSLSFKAHQSFHILASSGMPTHSGVGPGTSSPVPVLPSLRASRRGILGGLQADNLEDGFSLGPDLFLSLG